VQLIDVLEAIAHVVTVIVGVILIFELHLLLRQRRMDTFLQVRETNRELIRMGIESPELLKSIGDGRRATTSFRYLQLWMNHVHASYMANTDGAIPRNHWESMKYDIADFIMIEEVAQHWKESREFYPEDFQAFIDSLSQTVAR